MLVSPSGFTPWKLEGVLKEMDFDHIVVLQTDSPKVEAAIVAIRKHIKGRDRPTLERITVTPAFDFIAWYRAYEQVLERHKQDRVTLNLTPGHGVAIAMGALVAARRNIPSVCFDIEGTGLHHVSPAVLFHLEKLAEADKRVLRELGRGPAPVTELAEKAKVKVPTASMSLKRLHQNGFVDRTKTGRQSVYELRAGVREFLGSLVA